MTLGTDSTAEKLESGNCISHTLAKGEFDLIINASASEVTFSKTKNWRNRYRLIIQLLQFPLRITKGHTAMWGDAAGTGLCRLLQLQSIMLRPLERNMHRRVHIPLGDSRYRARSRAGAIGCRHLDEVHHWWMDSLSNGWTIQSANNVQCRFPIPCDHFFSNMWRMSSCSPAAGYKQQGTARHARDCPRTAPSATETGF